MGTKKPSGKAEETMKEKDKEDLSSNSEKADISEVAERFAQEADRLALELADEHDKLLRIMAEYDNYRKRSQKERENIYSDVRGDTVLKFLPVYDNLERALKQETTDEAYAKGVEMILTQVKEVFSKLGVCEISAEPGEKFNPDRHDAVMHVEDENLGEGVIVEQFQKGFVLGDKVLRFSVVKVAN